MPDITETKARCAGLDPLRSTLRNRGATLRHVLDQHDVYFSTSRGWLKLRASGPAGPAELVAYHRDETTCRYEVTSVDDAEACHAGLAAVLGVLGRIHKRREVWDLDRTTVHLDDVVDLGTFVELETPVAAVGAHERCLALLGIDRSAATGMSYLEILGSREGQR